MDYVTKTNKNGGIIAVVGCLAIKKIFKKELLPVSTWKQAAITFLTISISHTVAETIVDEINKRSITPKPK